MKTLLLTLLGSMLILFGGGATLLVLFSGTWGIGHGYPILIASIPMLIAGTSLLWFLKRTKRI